MPTKVATLQNDESQAGVAPQAPALEQLLEMVRLDARRESQRYLDEVVVPEEAGE
jgi:hypothetical protein